MSKLRSVNTHFWSDNYVIDLDPTEKLLFLYLLTNENTNMLGIYELHVRKIAFETGIDKDMVLKIFERFNKDNKASYIEGYVCLHNFTKHQSYNTNMKKSALSSFDELPSEVREQDFIKPLLKHLEPFPEGSEPIAEYELEYERELEEEKEIPPSFDDCVGWLIEKKELSKPIAEKIANNFINFYGSKDWMVGKNKMKSWQHALGNCLNWEKHERLMNGQSTTSPFRTDAVHL